MRRFLSLPNRALVRLLLLACAALILTSIFCLLRLCYRDEEVEEEPPDFVPLDELLANNSAWLDSDSKLKVHRSNAGVPYVYESEVDFRVIVMTYSRARSLAVLLKSLDELELYGSSGSVEIWIDRDRSGSVSRGVAETAMNFKWKRGQTNVHLHSKHVGIYGQWIDTWCPRGPDGLTDGRNELALFLEDDMTVSPQAYRWIRTVHDKYGARSDFAGVSLNAGDQMFAHNSGEKIDSSSGRAFMYVCVGTWGFSPAPDVWLDFQEWFHDNTSGLSSEEVDFGSGDVFRPYVDGSKPSEWYREFVRTGRAHTMWEMWLIFYTTRHSLLTVFSGLGSKCFGLNRQEIGLHQNRGSSKLNDCDLVSEWSPEFADLPDEPDKFDWWGNRLST